MAAACRRAGAEVSRRAAHVVRDASGLAHVVLRKRVGNLGRGRAMQIGKHGDEFAEQARIPVHARDGRARIENIVIG